MEEKKIYHEIPSGKNKFHSAILTSFSFNFHHFEYQVLKALKQKYITNIGILTDADMLDNSVGMTSAGLQQLTQSYSVNGIHCRGAFHPKINFIAGDNEALVIFGSGNISPSGHGKNHETFTALYADKLDDKLLPLINEAWHYIITISKDVQGFSKDRIVTSIPKNCSLLGQFSNQKHQFYKADDDNEIALLYNDETSILSQVTSLIPTSTIETISIVSPYFDEDGAFLMLLLDEFPKANLEIYIPKENGLPPTKLIPNPRIKFYSWEDTKRGQLNLKSNETFYRSLHSKVFQFKSKELNYFIIGSANATIPGFGTMKKRGINEEFGAIYKSSKTDFFKLLDITKSHLVKSINEYKRSQIINIEKSTNKLQFKIKLVSCDVIGSKIKIYYKDSVLNNTYRIFFYNDIGYVLFHKEINIIEDMNIISSINQEELIQNPIYVQVISIEGEVLSNKQLINYTEKLFHTDPSKENRTIRGLIGALEIGKINEFEIMNYLNDLNSNYTTSYNSSTSNNINSDLKKDISIHPEMTYEEAMNAIKDHELIDKISQTHNAIRIWEIISKLFKEKETNSLGEINDEEEEASVSISNDRKSSTIDDSIRNITDENQCKTLLKKTEKLTQDYIRSLNKINLDKETKINEIHYCQFLLITHILTAVHHFTDYELKFKSKKPGGITSENWPKSLINTYSIYIRDILISFSKFILNHEEEEIIGNELREIKMVGYKQKVLSHILIYHYLINQNKSENPLSQILDLTCLNIFDKLGKPDEESERYIEQLSKMNTSQLFNFHNVYKLKTSLSNLLDNLDNNDKIFREKHRGICYITEYTISKAYYKSIYSPELRNEISIKDIKKSI
jgi:hypothetical protein